MQLSKEEFLAEANADSKGTLMESLEIEFIDYGDAMAINADVYRFYE